MKLVQFEGFPFVDGGITAPRGFRAAGIHCGYATHEEKMDLALLTAAKPVSTAAVYTTNRLQGAPIGVTKEHLSNGYAQAVIANSGIANVCVSDGAEKAEDICEVLAEELSVRTEDIVIASTGVIGDSFPAEFAKAGIPDIVRLLSEDGGHDFAEALMSTDTVCKEIAIEFMLSGKKVRLGGCAKGSAMIHPNMATMLCFVTTDAAIAPDLLHLALRAVVRKTFNMVSVDGDSSPNDTCCIMASGEAGNHYIAMQNDDFEIFVNGLYAVMMNLSRMVAADGEGAGRLVECVTAGGHDFAQAAAVSHSVIESNVVKSSVYSAVPDWGSVLCAIGSSPVPIQMEKLEIVFSSDYGTIPVCRNGKGIPFSKEVAAKILSCDEVKVFIDLHDGDASAVAWGCGHRKN